MSEGIKRMLAEQARAGDLRLGALRRELARRIVESRRAKFIAAFERQQRYHRMKTGRGPNMDLDVRAACEAAELAQDPGWGADRAWRFSETRDACLAEVEAELERRGRQ